MIVKGGLLHQAMGWLRWRWWDGEPVSILFFLLLFGLFFFQYFFFVLLRLECYYLRVHANLPIPIFCDEI